MTPGPTTIMALGTRLGRLADRVGPMDGDPSAGPVLDGVRVVELSQLIAAPFCGLTLLYLGAEVIKVEPPAGDPMRGFPPYLPDGESGMFRALNRGKRGVVVDLTQAPGQALAAPLLETADVVVENLGDVRAQLGLSYEDLAARRPGLVWCAITGLGAAAGGRAIDPSLQAAMGMISITGEEDGGPARIPVPLVDFMTGMYAVQSVLTALWRVRQGGAGAFLDCAMLDAATTLVSTSALLASGGYFVPRRLGSESPLVAPSGVFAAGDGAEVQIMCVTERHWRRLCAALEHPEWIDDPVSASNSARVANRDEVRARIAAVIASDTAERWVTRIAAEGGLCERVRDIEEAWADERLRARGLVGEVGDAPPWAMRMPLVSLAATQRDGRLPPAPALGADTGALARELAADAR
jgi:crotonobetainyl-CoA:carnitine CoA-transferase CaiB-like acyl-CoA transferase